MLCCRNRTFSVRGMQPKIGLNKHPEGKVIPVKEAFEFGRLFRNRYEEAGNESCCDI
jgi:hypothetical protein